MQTVPQSGSGNCLAIGTRVAEFEITGIVGDGGFGTVYLALDHSLQRTVALKEYLPPTLAMRGADDHVEVRAKRHQETFDAGLKSFINEARLLAQFDHPALIKVYRFWEQNHTAYMAMRYYEGKTLKEILSKQPEIATEAWWKSILKPILQALDVLSKVQILHRDISPENIIVQPNGKPVLLDFGAARQQIQNVGQELTVILRPGYAPIEQYADEPSMKQGPWTDIYAMSAVLYSHIAKKAPPASVARLIKDPLEPLTQSDYPEYSRQFLFAISKGLAVKPEDRPQTIAEFGHLLGLDSRKSSSKSRTSSSTSGTASEKSRPHASDARPTATQASAPWMRRAWFISMAGIACLTALGLYGYQSGKTTPAPTLPAASIAAADARSASLAPASQNKDSAPSARANATPSSRQTASAASGLDQQPDQQANDRQARSTMREVAKSAASARRSASRPASDSAVASGTMQIQVKPWGNILVDGVSRGVSPPLKQLVLSEGKHQIRVVNPHFPDHVVDVVITSRKTVKIAHDFSRPKR